jgi:hypothetical protein
MCRRLATAAATTSRRQATNVDVVNGVSEAASGHRAIGVRIGLSGMWLALEIQRHSFTNEVLQCIFVDFVILFDVDGTPNLPAKAGVE